MACWSKAEYSGRVFDQIARGLQYESTDFHLPFRLSSINEHLADEDGLL